MQGIVFCSIEVVFFHAEVVFLNIDFASFHAEVAFLSLEIGSFYQNIIHQPTTNNQQRKTNNSPHAHSLLFRWGRSFS